MKHLVVPALLIALGGLLDFVTIRRRARILEQFYDWWLKLSTLNLETAGAAGVRGFCSVVDRIFGRRLLSGWSLLVGGLLCLSAAVVLTIVRGTPLSNPVAGFAIAGSAMLGVLTLEGSRFLLHALERRVTFGHVLLFGLKSFFLIELTVIATHVSLALVHIWFIKIFFDHHLLLEDIVPVSALVFVTLMVLILIYLPVAALPGLCCIVAWILLLLLYLSSRLGIWVKHFLADRVESEWRSPFTSIATVISAFLTVAFVMSDVLDIPRHSRMAVAGQTRVIGSSMWFGAALGTTVVLRFYKAEPGLPDYLQAWADAYATYSGTSLPAELTPELKQHVWNLVQQWNHPDVTSRQDPPK
jgi:hypothetical protein